MLRLPATRRLARRDRSVGAAAVEAAIVLPVVLALFVGMLEFGLIFKDSLAISSGVRSGGRIASAEPLKRSFPQDAANQVANSLSAVNSTGLGMLYVYDPRVTTDPRISCPSGCVSFAWTAAGRFTGPSGTWDRCSTDSPQVAVMLSIQHQGLTSVSYASPTLVEKAVFAFEPASLTALCQ